MTNEPKTINELLIDFADRLEAKVLALGNEVPNEFKAKIFEIRKELCNE
jgi:hypothetical protein